jgi:hypothetical protein
LAGLPPLLQQTARISNPGGVIRESPQPAGPPVFLNLEIQNPDCSCY